MNKNVFIAILVATVICGAVTVALPTYANTHALFTISGFVELLIEKGIIPPSKADTARTAVAVITQRESSTVPQNFEHITVTASQLIEYSDRTYNQFEDVRGLILLAKNTSNQSVTLTAKRGCQIVYRIYSDAETMLYDSSEQARCQTDESVSYSLGADQTRMLQLTHSQDTYHLGAGVYTFEIEYPGYGNGELEVTIK